MTGLSRPRTSHANVAEHWVHPLWAVRPVVRPYVPLLHGFSLPVSELPVEEKVRGVVGSLGVHGMVLAKVKYRYEILGQVLKDKPGQKYPRGQGDSVWFETGPSWLSQKKPASHGLQSIAPSSSWG